MAPTKKETRKNETPAKKTVAQKSGARLEKLTKTPSTKPGKDLKPMAKSVKKPEPKIKLSVTKVTDPKAAKTKGAKGKSDKTSETLELKAELVSTSSSEDEEDEEGSASSGISSSGLAMAAATAGSETSAGSLKNFRHHPDIENFYRFIYENDLRYEALEIIDVMATQREAIKANRAARTRPN
jgi:hypothetical protein